MFFEVVLIVMVQAMCVQLIAVEVYHKTPVDRLMTAMVLEYFSLRYMLMPVPLRIP